jgi:hypothetical protein
MVMVILTMRTMAEGTLMRTMTGIMVTTMM